MLIAIIGMAMLLPQMTYASSSPEVHPPQIKDVKAWVKSIGNKGTCADEYLKRRKQLGWGMALTPLAVAGGAAVGFFGGAIAGRIAYSAAGSPNEEFASLLYVIGGAAIGTIAGGAVELTQETIATVNFFKNQNLIKAIYESRHQEDEALKGFYDDYIKEFPQDTIDVTGFATKIANLDIAGRLCDGSIVAPKRFKKGRKLKQLLATKSELFNYMSKNP
jgi:hypothetical protein